MQLAGLASAAPKIDRILRERQIVVYNYLTPLSLGHLIERLKKLDQRRVERLGAFNVRQVTRAFQHPQTRAPDGDA